MSEIEILLTCSICLERFRDPRMLPCFHSFCTACLEKYVKTQRERAYSEGIEEFSCPDCRSIFKLGQQESVTGIKASHFICNMIEALSIQNRGKTAGCFSCKAERASLRCVTCDLFMCQSCYGIHESLPVANLSKKHEVVSISETAEDRTKCETVELRKKPRCLEHDKIQELYCERCKKFICKQCMEIDHGNHDHSCLPVEEVAKKKAITLKTSLGLLEANLKKGNQAFQAVSDVMQRLHANLQRAKEEVNRHKQDVLETFVQNLEQKTQEMVNELEHEYNKVYEPLAKQNVEMKSFVEKAKISVDLTKSLLANGSPEDIIPLQEEIEKKVKILDKERPKPMKPVHYGHIQYRSKPLNDPNFTTTFQNFGEVACSPLICSLYTSSDILKGEDEYVAQMEQWLNEQCKWRLCYRATRDGWSAGDFHSCCDDKGPTVILVKVKDYIFGGYADQSWGGYGYKESTSSFLFSLRNHDNLPPFQAAVFQYYSNAIWNNPNYGPSFGYGYYGCDLYISNNPHISGQSYSNLGYMYKPPEGYTYRSKKTYSLLAGDYFFRPTEIEVFY